MLCITRIGGCILAILAGIVVVIALPFVYRFISDIVFEVINGENLKRTSNILTEKEVRTAVKKRTESILGILVVCIFLGTVVIPFIKHQYFNEKKQMNCTTDSDCARKYGDDSYEEDDYPEDNGGKSGPGIHSVDGYYRKDGTYVEPHIRSNPDGDPSNNLRR